MKHLKNPPPPPMHFKTLASRLTICSVFFLLAFCLACNKPKSDSNNSTSGTQANSTISGDFRFQVDNITKEVTIIQYIGTKKDVTIPATIDGNPVTAIGDEAFSSSSLPTKLRITSVKFDKPENIKRIGQRAFMDTDLDKIDLSETKITEIERATFLGCEKLYYINLSNTTSLQHIGSGVFSGCYALANINLTDLHNLQMIGEFAFSDCRSLIRIDLSNQTQLRTIDGFAFTGCSNLISVVWPTPTQLTTIKYAAFNKCSALTSMDLSSQTSLTSIGTNTFGDCIKLTSLTIPESVTRLGSIVYSNNGSNKADFSPITITMKANTPPSLLVDALNSLTFTRAPIFVVTSVVTSGSKILVPQASLDAYKNAEGFKFGCLNGGTYANSDCIQANTN